MRAAQKEELADLGVEGQAGLSFDLAVTATMAPVFDNLVQRTIVNRKKSHLL